MDRPSIATRVVHPPGVPSTDRSLTPAIYQSSVFRALNLDDAVRLETPMHGTGSYTRTTNPTVHALEVAIADLEGSDGALAFASGMAALSTVLLSYLDHGSTVVAAGDSFGDTLAVLHRLRAQMKLTLVLADLCSADGIGLIHEMKPQLVLLESVSNPLLRVADLRRIAVATHRHGGCLIVDNTMATPLNLRPLDYGADIVVHSASKYIAGHYAVIAGLVAADGERMVRILEGRTLLGTCLDPHAAWSVLQGMQTLAVRVERQNASARLIADWLTNHPRVSTVLYPGLSSHPDYQLAVRQLVRPGGVIGFQLAGGLSAVERLAGKVRIVQLAVSFGGTKTLLEVPALVSHVPIGTAGGGDELRLPIPADLVRLSVGLEDPEDLIGDLEQALD